MRFENECPKFGVPLPLKISTTAQLKRQFQRSVSSDPTNPWIIHCKKWLYCDFIKCLGGHHDGDAIESHGIAQW